MFWTLASDLSKLYGRVDLLERFPTLWSGACMLVLLCMESHLLSWCCRDLSKPIGALSPRRFRDFMERYREQKACPCFTSYEPRTKALCSGDSSVQYLLCDTADDE